MNGQAGKGSKRRPTDEKKFRENFDLINWKIKDSTQTKEKKPSFDYSFLEKGGVGLID